MLITKYGITFKRLKEEDIELVRNWRNSSEINRYMEYRQYITPEMQKKWFDSINNNNNLYFIMQYKGKEVGLINMKNIDWEKKILEGGIFFWEKEIYSTHIPMVAIFAFSEFYIVLGDLTAYAHILKTNTRVVKVIELFGFELCEGQENVENQLYRITRKNFLDHASKLRKAFYSLTGKERLKIIIQEEDYESGIAQIIVDRIDRNMLKETVETPEGTVYCF
jgi:UDP-4-amino-4,6-dideoxy-N-acetyl-beta-L-altrosamine N-acetyltransferase